MPQVKYVNKFDPLGTNKRSWFKILMPESDEKDFYRQTSSYNAFFHGWNKKIAAGGLKGNRSPTHLYMARDEWEVEWEVDREQKMMLEAGLNSVKISNNFIIEAEFNSLWEFYEHEGYDYKKKKWNTSAEIVLHHNAGF